jgi:hypothetical protein
MFVHVLKDPQEEVVDLWLYSIAEGIKNLRAEVNLPRLNCELDKSRVRRVVAFGK